MGDLIRFSRSAPRRLSRVPWFAAALIAAGTFWYFGDRTTSSDAQGQPIVGRASVIDGDTIEIHGTRIRLFGIDAPEGGQTCNAQGKAYRCGQKAALALSDRIGGKTVECRPKDRDRYGRVVAVCLVDGEDINGWMVAQGWALAYRYYSLDYVRQEQHAESAKAGMWHGQFVPPWDWRRGTR